MDNTTDLLQIKIEKAKKQLSEETLNAIAAVPWQATILQMRETKGYSFEQLGDLEIETELLLCGLLTPENYSKELESRMKLSKTEVNELVKEMNNLVFSKIKENLVKNIEKPGHGANTADVGIEKISTNITKEEKSNTQVLKSAGIEIIPEKLELPTGEKPKTETPPILVQKLSGYVKNEIVETKHSLENITKTNIPIPPSATASKPTMDPYREIPE